MRFARFMVDSHRRQVGLQSHPFSFTTTVIDELGRRFDDRDEWRMIRNHMKDLYSFYVESTGQDCPGESSKLQLGDRVILFCGQQLS